MWNPFAQSDCDNKQCPKEGCRRASQLCREANMTSITKSSTMVIVVALTLLALLDLARSIHVRQAFHEPAAVWHPDPKVYADTAWPPAAGVPAGAALGKKTYLEN